jgi:hypothetical protein
MIRVLAIVLLLTRVVLAQDAPQPPPTPDQGQPPPPPPEPAKPEPPTRVVMVPEDSSQALRDANAAASAGDWLRVSAYTDRLLKRQLDHADLAEAHRLAGIAALFAQPPAYDVAEAHFLAYLKLDLDAHLDPALYPPDVVNYFNDVRARHAAELKALRPQSKRYPVLAVLPPLAQFQNGDRVKGIVIGSLMGAFAITNVTTYFVLRSWCTRVERNGNESVTCDDPKNRADTATTLRALNITAGVALIVTYVYGVYDGVRGYRKDTRERALMPFASSTNGTAVFGVHLNF